MAKSEEGWPHEMLHLDTIETRIRQLTRKTKDTCTNCDNTDPKHRPIRTQDQTTLQETHTTNRLNIKHQNLN